MQPSKAGELLNSTILTGSGLTSDAPHEVLARDKSVGWKGYAIYGMAEGNVVTIKAGSTYVFELDLDYNGLYVPGRDPDEKALIADFYIQDYDHCVEWAVSANSLQAAIDEGKFGYTSDGVRYVTVSGEVTIPTEIGGEILLPRWAERPVSGPAVLSITEPST